MNLTLDQEKSMIINRFCKDIVGEGVRAGLLESDEAYYNFLKKYSDGELDKKHDRNIDQIIDECVSLENLDDLINSVEKFVPLFPWFYGEHISVKIEDGAKIIKENTASDERESFKNDLQSRVDENEGYLEFLKEVINEGKFGHIDHDTLIIDKFSAQFLERFIAAKRDHFEKLENVKGVYWFDYSTPTGDKIYKVLIAGELVPLIEEVLEEDGMEIESLNIDI